MSRGAIKALGTNVRLKNKFGEGYSLKINFDQDKADEVAAYVKQISPQAELAESFPGNSTYEIPKQDFEMSVLLERLMDPQSTALIRDWGLSQTTLEDVFLNIVKNDE